MDSFSSNLSELSDYSDYILELDDSILGKEEQWLCPIPDPPPSTNTNTNTNTNQDITTTTDELTTTTDNHINFELELSNSNSNLTPSSFSGIDIDFDDTESLGSLFDFDACTDLKLFGVDTTEIDTKPWEVSLQEDLELLELLKPINLDSDSFQVPDPVQTYLDTFLLTMEKCETEGLTPIEMSTTLSSISFDSPPPQLEPEVKVKPELTLTPVITKPLPTTPLCTPSKPRPTSMESTTTTLVCSSPTFDGTPELPPRNPLRRQSVLPRRSVPIVPSHTRAKSTQVSSVPVAPSHTRAKSTLTSPSVTRPRTNIPRFRASISSLSSFTSSTVSSRRSTIYSQSPSVGCLSPTDPPLEFVVHSRYPSLSQSSLLALSVGSQIFPSRLPRPTRDHKRNSPSELKSVPSSQRHSLLAEVTNKWGHPRNPVTATPKRASLPAEFHTPGWRHALLYPH